MKFRIITLFPEFFESPMKSGLLGKAVESGIISVDIVNLRTFGEGTYRRCDDYPYGGGSGMVLMPGPLMKAIESVKNSSLKFVFTSASGDLFDQAMVKKISAEKEICFVCGNYEGIDQRVIEKYADYELSIGDYVLSGGEFAALVMIDAIARYVPGFMSNQDSLIEESMEGDLLEYPQYTRPESFANMDVPKVLTGGNHAEIEKYRFEKRLEKTRKVRPDLYRKYLIRKISGELK